MEIAPQDLINQALTMGSTAVLNNQLPQMVNQGLVSRTRQTEYLWRAKATKDGLVKSIISAHLINAIGVKDTERPNISIHVDNDKIKDKSVREFLNKEADTVCKLLNKKLSFFAKDALAFGDGYISIRGEKGKGITSILYNLGSKPWHILPFKANIIDNDIGYLVANQFVEAIDNNRAGQYIFVGRMNLEDGSLELQEYVDTFKDVYNPFAKNLAYYTDSIHGGLLEGQKEAYDKFIGSINSSFEKKIASAIIERFITVAMNHSTVSERTTMKDTITKMIQITDKHRRGKIDKEDNSPSIVTHVVPTTSDNATGGLDIQDSSIDFKDDMQDVILYAKRLIGGLKFHQEFTVFSDAQEGERRQDSLARTSEQMEEVGAGVRDAITSLYKQVLKAHFSMMGNRIPKGDIWKVQFNAVTTQSKKEQEYDRVENLNNTSQYMDLISSIREMKLERTDANERLVEAFLRDSVPLNITNKDEYLEDVIELVFTLVSEEV